MTAAATAKNAAATAKKALPVLEDIRVASPCTMNWDDMVGGERVRFCAACQKNVFNLQSMTREEAVDLIAGTEGRVCARFYRRKDGTILTADCPVGIRMAAKRARRALGGALAASLSAVAALLAFLAAAPMLRGSKLAPSDPATDPTTTTTTTYIKSLLVPKEKPVAPEVVLPEMMMGDVAFEEPSQIAEPVGPEQNAPPPQQPANTIAH